MTPTEAQVLLTMASTFDNRKPSEDAAKAWAAALDDQRFEDCRLAVIEHYRTSAEWLMPATVRIAVRRIRSKRIAEGGTLTPPPDLTPTETCRWLATARQALGDGVPVERITTDHGGALRPRDLSALKAISAPQPEPLESQGLDSSQGDDQ